ncbi:hypothetical protein CTI12_AA031910 [Artemisia annua]|uniref:Uncharacterized protein n=1 Tax=Artemisia annua TaxID=35608 RepID=A0A2U1QGU9_ARTAN|nr:hypothetical protein CTI12_AA031910 [Artemisia annua]
MKKVAEADKLMMNGTEYCQISKMWNQSDKVLRSGLLWVFEEDGFVEMRAPLRIKALVAPQIRPTVSIFSMSPIMVFDGVVVDW